MFEPYFDLLTRGNARWPRCRGCKFQTSGHRAGELGFDRLIIPGATIHYVVSRAG